VTGVAGVDSELSLLTDEVVRRSLEVAAAATKQADDLEFAIGAIRETLWGGP